MLLLVINLVTLLSTIVFFYYLYCHYNCYKYWQKKGLPTLKPQFPLGNLSLSILGTESVYLRMQTIYNAFKRNNVKHGGIYFVTNPIYFPVDPEYIHKILVSDYSYFSDRKLFENKTKYPLSSNLATMKGDEWKNARSKLSPAFTVSKLKITHNIVLEICKKMVEIVGLKIAANNNVAIKDLSKRYATDVIFSAIIGVESNSLGNPDSELTYSMIKRVINPPRWKFLKLALTEGFQNPGNLAKLLFNNKSVERDFTKLVQNNMEFRERNNLIIKDLFHILKELKNKGTPMHEIVAHCYMFFFAGLETSAVTISYCLHELAHNQFLQNQLRQDLKQLGDLSQYKYEEILNLDSLDNIIKGKMSPKLHFLTFFLTETLRKYPPGPLLSRVCVKKYQIPGTRTTIEPGTTVFIPVLGVHRDPDFYPEPLKFHPDRFKEAGRHLFKDTFIPFGDGPKTCIGKIVFFLKKG